MRTLPRCLLALTTSLGLALAPTAAHAGSVTDPKKDAPASIDITKVAAKQTDRGATITVSLRRLARSATTTLDLGLEQLYKSHDARAEDHALVWFTGKKPQVTLYYLREIAVAHDPCSRPSVRVSGKKKTLTVSIPRDCLAGDNPVQVSASATMWDRDFTLDGYRFDYWEDDREIVATDGAKEFKLPAPR